MIDTEALRKKVIDLAIQGKLTEQLPSDGDAETLYAQIQEEKNKQIKEGKIKKDKPLPEAMDSDIPFDIPRNWKWVRFGETTFIERGGSPRPIKSYITDSEDGINWIKIGDVEKGGKYIYSTKEKIIPEGEKKSRRVYPGDFLLTNSMSFGRPYISKVEGCIHDGWLLIRDLKGFSADYLYYLLSSSYMYGQFCNKASGATVDNLNIDKVNTAMIPLPPMEEQKRIAEVIDKVDVSIKVIDDLQAKYSNDLAVLKSKIIDAGIRGKLTEQLPEDGDAESLYAQIQKEKTRLIDEGKIRKIKNVKPIISDDEPFTIPDCWKWVRINDVALTIVDCPHSTPHYLDEETGYYAIDTNCINENGYITGYRYVGEHDYDERIKRLEPQVDDIIYTREGSICRAAILPDDRKICLGQRVMLIRCPKNLDVYYLKTILMSKQTVKALTSKQRGIGVNHVNVADVCNLMIPLPPYNEQRRIVETINQIERAIC